MLIVMPSLHHYYCKTILNVPGKSWWW